MKKEVLVVLGGPNSVLGELSAISKSRLNHCALLYREGKQVLCTGGWGEGFNTSEAPHAFYAKQYLLRKGVKEDDFLAFALSKHTVDDAVKVKEVLYNREDVSLKIITSDFHVRRVKLIFNEILSAYDMDFIGVSCQELSGEALEKRLAHEKKAVEEIQKKGLYY
ncbi:YdcF family protein [Aquimarina sp. TRL1]|uniref:YdcF family protein n=1 Tax=Aquimarina sp. (strain TRL1) TaxID=2736252 RepID=UPI001589C12B|nr:YdcF family protein [Aquimarina sp. TRL1]QKX05956.1 YdcF family protein [Aquimarina sp. TRL1]